MIDNSIIFFNNSIHYEYIIGGLALFLFGIQYMGDALKTIAGDKLTYYIDKYTNKSWKGILLGLIITTFIQSSSATIAITIGLVRADLMKFKHAAGIVVGSFIGTTITAFLVGLNIEEFALYFIFIGVLITLLSKNKTNKYLGQVILGFGLLFFGLKLMSNELTNLAQLQEVEDMIKSLSNKPYIALFSGTIFTAIIQSSSASISVIQKIYANGAINLSVALPFIFGCSIGTNITSFIAVFGGNKESKKVAIFGLVFNVIGALIFMFVLNPFVDLIVYLTNQFDISTMMQIAIAHIIRAFVTAIIIYPFLNIIVKTINSLFKTESIKNDLSGLDENLIKSFPSAAIANAKNNIYKMGEIILLQLQEINNYLNNKDKQEIINLEKNQRKINKYHYSINNYLTKISYENLSEADNNDIITSVQVIKSFENISLISNSVSDYYLKLFDNNSNISINAENDLKEIHKVLYSLLENLLKYYLTNDYSIKLIINDTKKYLDIIIDKTNKRHLIRVKEHECIDSGVSSIYLELLNNIKRIEDELYNITKK